MPYVDYIKEISEETNCELFVDVPFHFPQYIIKHYPHKIILVVLFLFNILLENYKKYIIIIYRYPQIKDLKM